MNIELKDISDTRKTLVVTLDKGEVDAEHQAVVGEFTKMVRLPGFRPGKAPAPLVLKRFGKEVTGEFHQKVVGKAYRSAIEQRKLDVVTVVHVEQGTIEAGLSAAITITVDVRPEFKIPDYAGLPTEIAPTEPAAAEVDAAVEALRAERAEFKVAERAAQKGDYVKLGYEGRVDGKPIAEIAADHQVYGKMPQTWEEVEGEQEGLIPGLGKQLAGLKAGDKREVTVAFPAEFAAVPALAGKTAAYAVDVQEVRERALPALDGAFFKAQEVDGLDALKAQLRKNLTLRKEYENRAAQRRQVTDALVARADFPIPESLVESETQGVLRQFMEENLRRGVPPEQFEKDKQQLVDGARKAATGRVKMQMVLAKIAEAEKLSVSEKDIDNFIYREAARSNQRPEKIAKDLGKDREQLRAVQQSIIFDKALDFVVSKATVSTAQPKGQPT